MYVRASDRCLAGPASFEQVAVGEDGLGDEFAERPNPCRALDGRMEKDPEVHHAVDDSAAEDAAQFGVLVADVAGKDGDADSGARRRAHGESGFLSGADEAPLP